MVLFRPHRSGLAEAMREVREVATRDELARHLGPEWAITAITPYGFDARIGWDTFLVEARLHDAVETFVVGFTNGPL